MKKLLSILLAALLIISTVPMAFATDDYPIGAPELVGSSMSSANQNVVLISGENETYYASLYAAFEAGQGAAEDAPTKIILNADISERLYMEFEGAYILDLAGHTLTSEGYTLALKDNIVLTIEDSVGTGIVATDSESGCTPITLGGDAKLTILGGTINGEILCFNGEVNEAILNIEGGTFNGRQNIIATAEKINISGGTFNASMWENIYAESWNTVTITGSPVFNCGIATENNIYLDSGVLDLSGAECEVKIETVGDATVIYNSVCEDCGRETHAETGVPMYICLLITLIKLVVSFVQEVIM